MGRLDNKVAIVTGGAQGQGAGIVRAFVAEGAKVAIADVAKEPGQALADELGANAHFVHHDVSDEASWASLVEDTNQRWGPVNVLANNAGILRFGEIGATPLEDVELLFRVNQLGLLPRHAGRGAHDEGQRRRLDHQRLLGRGPRRACPAARRTPPPSGRSAG